MITITYTNHFWHFWGHLEVFYPEFQASRNSEVPSYWLIWTNSHVAGSHHNSCKMQDCWESTFLKDYFHVNTKWALKRSFIVLLFLIAILRSKHPVSKIQKFLKLTWQFSFFETKNCICDKNTVELMLNTSILA